MTSRAFAKLALAACVAAVVSAASAVETTTSQARTAVRNWVKRNAHPMATALVSGEGDAHTYRNDEGKALFHAVNLEGGGFVVASGDTKVSPIVAFSDTGSFEATMKNPLYALVLQHMGKAREAIDAEASGASTKGRSRRLSASGVISRLQPRKRLSTAPPCSYPITAIRDFPRNNDRAMAWWRGHRGE